MVLTCVSDSNAAKCLEIELLVQYGVVIELQTSIKQANRFCLPCNFMNRKRMVGVMGAKLWQGILLSLLSLAVKMRKSITFIIRERWFV